MNKINKDGLELIKSFEGLELEAYKDAVGVWTIGYGHTAMAGAPVPVAGMKLTEKEATDLLLHDLVKYEQPVKDYVKVSLNDNQYSALVSFVYNLGGGNFKSSTLLKKINNRDFAGAAEEFAKWNKAGGKVLKGLTRRRAAEKALFLKSVSEDTEKPVQTIPSTPAPKVAEKSKPAPKSSTAIFSFIVLIFKSIFGRQ